MKFRAALLAILVLALLLPTAAFAAGNEGAFDADDTAPEPPVPAEA